MKTMMPLKKSNTLNNNNSKNQKFYKNMFLLY